MFILGKRLTEYFKKYEGYDDIIFGSFGEPEQSISSIEPISKKDIIEDVIEYDKKNFTKLTFGSFESDEEIYKPSFGTSFKCGINNIERIDRIELGNMLLINKMLFLNTNINTHIFNNTEKRFIRELKKKLNRDFSCCEEYELNVSILLNDKTSFLNRFLISNEKMLFEHYEKEYENTFKNLSKEYLQIKKEQFQYMIREKTAKEPYVMIKPINNKYYDFKEKELELYNIFLNNQRSIIFKDEIEYFEWLGTCREFSLLQEWNCVWLLHRNIEILKSQNEDKYIKNIEELEKELEKVNLELGRRNEDYLFV